MGISKLISEIYQSCDSDQTLYFRGQRSKDLLLPKLLRTNYDIDLIKENHLYCNSWVMGNEEISNARNSWEVLSKMQHYGISTRLLDWSSSLIAAIFFAIDECRDCLNIDECHTRKKKGCRGNPVIWVLNPGLLHNKLYPKLEILSFTIGIDNMVPDYCKSFITNKIKWKYKNGPIFIEIPWSNSRISKQKGYFTFHHELKSEELKPLNQWCTYAVKKFEINPELKKELIEEFRIMGIDEFDVFSDLMSIGRHTERAFK